MDIKTLEQFEKVVLENKEVANKLSQISAEGFRLDSFMSLKDIYLGKPVGFADCSIVLFKQDNFTREICLYNYDNSFKLFQGSYNKMIRIDKELRRVNNVSAYLEISRIFSEILGKNSCFIDGSDIRQLLHSKSKNRVLKAFNILISKADEKSFIYNDEEYKIINFLANEVNGRIEDDKIVGGFDDKVFYIRNVLLYSVKAYLNNLFLSGDIKTYRKLVEETKELSSVLYTFDAQTDFLAFIKKHGTSTDLQNIIYGDTLKPNGEVIKNKINISTCDILLSMLNPDKINKTYTYNMITPVFTTLYNTQSIGKGFKQRIARLLAKYIFESESLDIKEITTLLKTDICDSKSKGMVIEQYLLFDLEGNKKAKDSLIKNELTFSKRTDFAIEKIKSSLPLIDEPNPYEKGEILLEIFKEFLHEQPFAVNGSTVTVFENNKIINEVVEHKYEVPEIKDFIKKINDYYLETVTVIANLMVKYGIDKNIINDNIEVSIKDNIPNIQFDVFNFQNKDNKLENKKIAFNDSQRKKVLANSKNNNPMDLLYETLDKIKSCDKKELKEKTSKILETLNVDIDYINFE